MKTVTFSVLLILSLMKSDELFCQTNLIDSLIRDAQGTAEDTNKVKKLNNLSFMERQAGNFEQARQYAQEALVLAEHLSYPKGSATAFNRIGNAYDRQGNYPLALENYLHALQIFNDIGSKRGMASCYSYIGIIYYKQGDYEKAVSYFLQDLMIYKELNSVPDLAISYSEVAGIYQMQGKDSIALSYLMEGLKFAEQSGNKELLAGTYLNIGIIHSDLGEYQQALEFHRKSLAAFNDIDDRDNVASSYNNIGNENNKLGNYTSAIDSLYKGLEISKEIGSKDIGLACYDNLAIAYYHLGNIDSTYRYMSLHYEMRDSLLNEENSRQINEMQAKYEAEKKDKEIAQLNLENEKKQNQLSLLSKQRQIAELNLQTESQQKELVTSENERNKQSLLLSENSRKQQQDSINNLSLTNKLTLQQTAAERNKRNAAIGSGIGAVLLLSFFFWYFFRRRKEKYGIQLNQLNNKVLRSQLNPHFIFNALESIRNYIRDHPEIANSYLLKFSKLMRQVLENSTQEKITLSEELDMMKNYMELESMRLPAGFDYEIIVDGSIDAGNTLVPPLILQPTIENSIWHGLSPLKNRGKISIRITEKDNLIRAFIEDNGVGSGNTMIQMQSPAKKRSLGMQITRDRLALLNRKSKMKGKLVQQLFEQGSQVEIAIPV